MEPAVVDEAEPTPAEPAELNAAEQHYIDELQSELCSLAQIPLVTAVSAFDKGDEMQQKGVLLSLDAQFLSRGKARQIQVHCSEKEGWSRKLKVATQPKPTHLDAARVARAELERDYVEELAAAAAAGSSASSKIPVKIVENLLNAEKFSPPTGASGGLFPAQISDYTPAGGP